jgi:hypothetical protein
MEYVLCHHGIKGQKWGIRRFQNPDGTLTPAGRERYYKDRVKELKKEYYSKTPKEKRTERGLNRYIVDNYGENYRKDKKLTEERSQKRLAIGATVATATAAGVILGGMALQTIGAEEINSRTRHNDRSSVQERIDNMMNDESGYDKINKDTEIKRLIFTDNVDKSAESMYVSDNETSNDVYVNMLSNQKSRWFASDAGKKEATLKFNEDAYIAKGKDAVNYALEALGSNKSVDEYDNPKHPDIIRAQKAILSMNLKTVNGQIANEDARKVREKLIDEGYSGVKDYVDAGILSASPKVLFNQDKDQYTVEKIKDVSDARKIKGQVNVGLKKIMGKKF